MVIDKVFDKGGLVEVTVKKGELQVESKKKLKALTPLNGEVNVK
jgi:hypothetical protein